MSSGRRPEHGGSAPLGVPPAPRVEPVFDSVPAELAPEPAVLEARPSHLVPCGQCGALNGRSAIACWACEADLLALVPFASGAAPRPPEPVAVPVVPQQTVVERDGHADGRRGLHLVSRGAAPPSVQPAPGLVAPDFSVELPVLTVQVEDPVPLSTAPNARRPYPPPLIALALAAVLLLVVAAGLRWWGAPAAVASPPLAGNPALAGAALDRPLLSPAQSSAPDAARLAFPPLDVAPDDATADLHARAPARARAATAPARAGGKARETRPAVAQTAGTAAPAGAARQRSAAPAACTSNMAALGFCTLEPASAKE